MKWSETIPLDQPLREVVLLTAVPERNWEDLMRAREAAAYQRGRHEGESALGQQLIQQRTELAELQHGILASLAKAVPEVIHETETALITLALEAAKRVVADLPIDAGLVEAVVREALQQAEDTAEITVQLNAEDLALLRKQDASVLKGIPDKGPLRFLPSSEISRGGCMVQTRFGLIDARREIKLDQIKHSLST